MVTNVPRGMVLNPIPTTTERILALNMGFAAKKNKPHAVEKKKQPEKNKTTTNKQTTKHQQ
jgi:hypothetical protein